MKPWIFLFVLMGASALAGSSVAQDMLRGRVIDAELGEPIFSANVIIEGTTTGVTTDFDGQFLLPVSTFPVKLQVSFIGYSLQTVTVQNASDKLTIKLVPTTYLKWKNKLLMVKNLTTTRWNTLLN